ncbi:MAG: DASS family sodium-coupled anion symporter [Saprospiraceae bacterium]|nr:DASS family sodium-coupled anion symporter [Saprospiraceae bacterium]
MPRYKLIGYLSGPLLFFILLLLPLEWPNPIIQKVLAIGAWMIVWWITEVVSLSVTALIPLTIFPLLGVMDFATAAKNYASPIVFLFFGGFVLALAIEKVNLHKRIALNIIRLTGTSPNRIILGFMISTAALSMWISNTASTVVMLPIAISVIRLLIQDADGFTKNDRNFALSLMLGIAFSANIGGTATLIGTPPNTVLVGFMAKEYDIELSFVNWMLMALPFMWFMLFLNYLVLVKWLFPNRLENFESSKEVIQLEIDKLGSIHKAERMVLAVFALVAGLWIFRAPINSLFQENLFSDAGISMLGALLLFSLPVNMKEGTFILHWDDTQKLPWGILILFGGGLALASGMAQAGIIDLIGDAISVYKDNPFFISSLSIFVVLFLTELMSNVALVNIFIPVLAGIAIGLNIPILYLAIPATLASSCAFMLPMATPPNAIVFASGHVKVYQMAKAGIVLNLIAVVLLIILAKTLVPALF